LKAAAAQGGSVPVSSLGRFAEPRLGRALEQLTEPQALALARSLHAEAHARP
jgi:hypothetical protein